MFDNIGGKIKTLAKVICWIGIIGSILGGFIYLGILLDNDQPGMGALFLLLIGGGGSLVSWIGSFSIYALGELVENSAIIRENTDLLLKIKGAENPTAFETAKNPEFIKTIYQDKKQNDLSESEAMTPIDDAKESPTIGTCAICGKEDVPVNECELIEFENGIEKHRDCLVCKDCQKKYK